jgi:hypothetical protein
MIETKQMAEFVLDDRQQIDPAIGRAALRCRAFVRVQAVY